MRITVDRAACTGHGRCFVLAPDVFDADDDGYTVVRCEEVPSELEEQARIGVSNCPERAISFE